MRRQRRNPWQNVASAQILLLSSCLLTPRESTSPTCETKELRAFQPDISIIPIQFFRTPFLTVIGLTGGIASGKSTVSDFAESQGAHVIDADKLGHQAYEPGTACFHAVVAEFGADVVADDGTIDRRVLGGKVFAEGSSLERLTDIVWPAIKQLAKDEIASVTQTEPKKLIVLEAAVLLEAGWQDFVDQVWVITVDVETAISRTMSRDGLDRQAVQARIAAQLSNEERTAEADVVIDNSGTEAELLENLGQAFAKLNTRSAN